MKIDKRTTKGKNQVDDIKWRTRFSKGKIEDVNEKSAKMILDPEREQRESEYMCIYCFYTPMLAGQGFTNYECHICEKEFSHPNTSVPRYCGQCAKDNGICRHCGSQIYNRHGAVETRFNLISF